MIKSYVFCEGMGWGWRYYMIESRVGRIYTGWAGGIELDGIQHLALDIATKLDHHAVSIPQQANIPAGHLRLLENFLALRNARHCGILTLP
jgi:hypothetical protein